MKGVFDTNILIDYLQGIATARKEIEKYQSKYISIISYIEVLVGTKDSSQENAIKDFLSSFEIINVDTKIADLSIVIRKKFYLKIPDAIILATAEFLGGILITRNTKDFTSEIPLVRIPYKL